MRLDDSREFRNNEYQEKHDRQLCLPRMKTPGMTSIQFLKAKGLDVRRFRMNMGSIWDITRAGKTTTQNL